MKKRLNLLSTILLIAFGTQFLMQTFYMAPEIIQSFREGYEAGTHLGEKAVEQNSNSLVLLGEELMPVPLNLAPNQYGHLPDSLYNTKTGNWMPANIDSVIVEYKKEINLYEQLFIFLTSLLYTAGLIVAFVYFIRLVLAINKSVIFEWKNVKRLRRIGAGFIVAFICNFIMEYINYNFASSHILLSNYTISCMSLFKGVNLIFGFISLLLAEVFAIGLRIKEQQELTI